MIAVPLIENLTDLQNILSASGKGGRNKVKALLDSENNIIIVLFADKRHIQIDSGHIDALFIGNEAAVFHGAVNILFRHLIDPQLNKSVINENGVSYLHIFDQIPVGDRHNPLVSQYLLGRQYKALALFQLYLAALHIAGADLRAFGV